MNLKIFDTGIKDLILMENRKITDSRGYFYESYNKKDLENSGIDINFVQDNISYSHKNVLRGMHYQINFPQTKLIHVIKGKSFDVVIDLRKNSETFCKIFSAELSDTNNLMLLIPKGFAHGFLSVSDEVIFHYKVDDYYKGLYSSGFLWNDNYININWNLNKYSVKDVIISESDRNLQSFESFVKNLI
ncbi:MAG: dTDP-4-dehydrorhamnose 3,5-epimerase [Thermotogae bacterium]|nr:dTDP-4-dehydrorhamnose 3,5-epimerase [Thermotogota bacterium]MCP5465837.1 dTDP-4-dehydrorhamnose 3,5-epimerase [Thermotogota bacterium]HOO73906.1 dTDP-4-dehydrorhamnose 3,5-epimerase [Tepiditoga sp.]